MWDISTGMCLMTLVSSLVFFSRGHSCICKTILNGINYLTCLCFQEKTVTKIRQTLEIVLLASIFQILLLLRYTKNLKIHTISEGVLWWCFCDE